MIELLKKLVDKQTAAPSGQGDNTNTGTQQPQQTQTQTHQTQQTQTTLDGLLQSLNQTNQAVMQLQQQMTSTSVNTSNLGLFNVNQIGNNMSQPVTPTQINKQISVLPSFGTATGNQTNVLQFQMMMEGQELQRLHAQQRRAAYAQMAGYNLPYYYY